MARMITHQRQDLSLVSMEQMIQKKAIHISANTHNTCAVIKDGTVQCWGLNSNYGQLGNGTDIPSNIPVYVTGIDGFTEETTATKVAIGAEHACAIMGNGSVNCWGRNDSGQLGDGSITHRDTPVPVNGMDGSSPDTTATDISAGGYLSCALMADQSVKCWGGNRFRQLGNGSSINSTTPITVQGLDGSVPVTSIGAGFNYACAHLEDSTILCWGDNQYGQLGTEVKVYTDYYTPIKGNLSE